MLPRCPDLRLAHFVPSVNTREAKPGAQAQWVLSPPAPSLSESRASYGELCRPSLLHPKVSLRPAEGIKPMLILAGVVAEALVAQPTLAVGARQLVRSRGVLLQAEQAERPAPFAGFFQRDDDVPVD